MSRELLTHSRLHAFKSCRRRAWYAYEHRVRKRSDAKALRMGSAYHAALDKLKRNEGLDAAIAEVRAAYALPLSQADDDAAYALEIEQETVATMVSGYVWRWQDSSIQFLESEKSWSMPLTNPATNAPSTVFDLAGVIDGIARLEDGRLAVVEHKLLGEDIGIESDFWRRLQLDHQVSLYVKAARHLGFAVDTVLYDVARKPTIQPTPVPVLDEEGRKIVVDENGSRVFKPPTKAQEKAGAVDGDPRQSPDKERGWTLATTPMTADQWKAKLCADMGERPEFYYTRREVPRLDQDLQDLSVELWDIQRTYRDAQRLERWYRTVGRDTCPFCPFFDLCTVRFVPGGSDPLPESFEVVDDPHQELDL